MAPAKFNPLFKTFLILKQEPNPAFSYFFLSECRLQKVWPINLTANIRLKLAIFRNFRSTGTTVIPEKFEAEISWISAMVSYKQ
jgi:hypothetical protein